MDWYDIAVNRNHTVNFTEVLPKLEDRNLKNENTETTDTSDNKQCRSSPSQSQSMGGIIKGGEWAWLARNSQDSTLQIMSLRNGNTISKYSFGNMQYTSKDCKYRIRFIEELFPGSMQGVVLAVCLERINKAETRRNEWYIALYYVQNNCLLRCIQVRMQITCLSFIEAKCCRKTFCQNFDGCLSVGTQEGVILVIDLNMKRILSYNENQTYGKEKLNMFTEAFIVDYRDKLFDLFASFGKCRQEDLHFGLQMEVIESPCAISSILPISLVLGLAVGFSDGRLALYDLTEFYFLVVLKQDEKQYKTPLKRMNCIIPHNDPRPCFYIFSLHESKNSVSAALHIFLFKDRLPDSDDEGSYVFKNIHKGITRLRYLLENTKSSIIGCQSISTMFGDNDANSLSVLGWYSDMEEKHKLVIFDLNQWYNEGMPETVKLDKPIKYLAGYVLNGTYTGLHVQIKEDSITPFNTMQRYEEHFYPNSLSFECSALVDNSCRIYTWEGAQNRFINMLRCRNATIFLDPHPFHEEIVRTRLVPQFCEQDINSTFSKSAMYEVMLSVALENNCYSLLRDCARSWVDGSFICNLSLRTELSLSTLTNWIFKRASQIKERCNAVCGSVLVRGNYQLDEREQKELGFITRQLRFLSKLQSDVLHFGKSNIPDMIFEKLSETAKAINIAAEYQEVLNWLLNIGLLPEMMPTKAMDGSDVEDKSAQCLHYPFKTLSQFYADKRTFFGNLSSELKMPNDGCRVLFIDALLVHYDLVDILNEYWAETNGKYPPASIETLLRVMLAPGVEFERKSAVLLYFLLDLNMVLDEMVYKNVLEHFIKFQSVFKLSATLVKTVETFWSLDHGKLVMAVEQFLSPINNTQIYAKWQVELLVESLLVQNAAKLALGILDTRPGIIPPMLKLKTLLGNEMISEAFHFARSRENESKESLLEMFFKCCIHAAKFGVLRDLSLTQKESQTAQRILRESKIQGAESLHFAYLLQKSKYIEAVAYMDEISRARDDGVGGNSGDSIPCNSIDHASNMMLTAYSKTMAPVTQSLTENYFRMRNKVRLQEVNDATPEPFSSQLLKQNANTLLGGIYHSSALSAHFATYYWGNMADPSQSNDLLSTANAPFLRKPQNETNFLDLLAPREICRPTPYQPTEKRTREKESEGVDLLKTKSVDPPLKRRRLLGEDIVNDLSHFVTSNFGKSENHHEFTNDYVLTQPLPRPLRNLRPEAVNDLPGILKPSAALPEFTSCRNMGDKSLRFKHPLTEDINADKDQTISYSQNMAMPVLDSIEPSDVFRSSFSQSAETSSSTAVDDCNLSKVSLTKRDLSVISAQPIDNNDPLSLESLEPEDLQMEVCDTVDQSPAVRITNLLNYIATDEMAQLRQQTEQHKSVSRSNQNEIFETIESNPDENIVELLTEETEMPPVVCSNVLQTNSPGSSRCSSANDQYLSAIASTNVSQTTTTVSNQYGLGPKPRHALHYKSSSTGDTQVTSGIASFALSSFNTMQGNINDFASAMCSSKVCESQSKFSDDNLQAKSTSNVKFSECTTIIGSLNSEMGASQIGPQEQTQMSSAPFSDTNKEQLQAQMLDTTLSMSTYDFTNVDSTAYIQPIQDECTSDIPSVPESDQGECKSKILSGVVNSSDERTSETSSITLSEVFASELLNSNDCGESSIPPSIEESVDSSTPFESDVVAMSTTTSPLHLDRSSIDDVLEIDDQFSESEFAEIRYREKLPLRSSLYRVCSLETIPEVDTPREPSGDDECVEALDGTKVRDYMPSDFKSLTAAVETVATEPNTTSSQRDQSVGSSTESILRILYSNSSENSVESQSDVNAQMTQSKLTLSSSGIVVTRAAVTSITDGESDEELVVDPQSVKTSESTVDFAWQDDQPSTSKGLTTKNYSAVMIEKNKEIDRMTLVSGSKSIRSERASSVPISDANKTNPQNLDGSQNGKMDGKMLRTTSEPCDFNKRFPAWQDIPEEYAMLFRRRLVVKIESMEHESLVPLKKSESPVTNDIESTPTTSRRYFLRTSSQQSVTELSGSAKVADVTPRRRAQAKDKNADKKQVDTEKSMPRSKRGSSAPATDTPKGLLKRNNPILDSIHEDVTLNKPLTRSRQRLCSITSDIDNSPAVDMTPKRRLRTRSVDVRPSSTKKLSTRALISGLTEDSVQQFSKDSVRSRQSRTRTVSSSKVTTIDAKKEQEEDSKQNIEHDTRPLKKRGRPSKK